MKKTIKKVSALVLAMAMALSVCVVAVPAKPVEAATKNVTANSNWKKAPAVKTGTYKVKAKAIGSKSSYNYLKFTAPSDGTYVFTFSALNGGGGSRDNAYGTHYVKEMYNEYSTTPSSIKVKTNYGSTYGLSVTTKYNYNNYDKKSKNSVYKSLYTRTATIKLKKGKVLYLDSHAACDKSTYTYSLNIKKKK